MNIVTIGNGPAAIKALEAIATHKASLNKGGAEITVISEEMTAPYSPMFLADYLTGELGEEKIQLGEKHGLSLKKLLGKRVVKVEESLNRVVIEGNQVIDYDKLLIASGASPFKTSIKGIDKQGVYYFNRLEDIKRLSPRATKAENIIIIGAGVIGLEAAIAFNRMGRYVLVVELLDQILPQILEKDLAARVEGELSSSGIRFVLGEGVSEITGDNRATGVIVGNEEIPGDLILMAIGVKPNVDFLESSSVRINHGILVNERMQTNIQNIYAAGDVAESIDPYGGCELVFNWYNAIEQGWVAGCNMVGVENIYRASPRLVVLKGLETPVVSIGCKYFKDGYETLSDTDEEKGVYERFFIKDNHIDCYQAIGVSDKVGLIYGYIKERKDIRNIGKILCGNYLPVSLVA